MSKLKIFSTLSCLLLITCFVFLPLAKVEAAKADPPTFEYESGGKNIAGTTGLGDQDPIVTVTYVINWALSLLGLLALVFMLYGGFIWMNARGRDDEVQKAKDIIQAAVIGLVIILASYGISYYVFNKLIDVTTTAYLIKPAHAATAYSPTDLDFEYQDDKISSGTQLGTQNPIVVAGYIINVALTLLGIFFMVLIIYGGFTWMNARGNDDEVNRAKEIIKGAVIGLVIILASYGITTYIFRAIYNISST